MTKKNSTRDYWLQHYKSFKTQEITQREYCRNNDLGYWTFNTWKRKFDKSETETTLQEIPIKISPKSTQASSIEIVLENSLRILIPDNFSENTLKKIITVLRNEK